MPEMNIRDQDHAMQMCDPSQQNMAKEKPEIKEITWDTKNDVRLLKSLIGLKPVGVNRYFTMMGIHQKFSTLLDSEFSSKLIWDHLDSFYDMSSLHESEIIPFPNEEVDFELPEDEFDEIVEEKFGVSLIKLSTEHETKNSGSKSGMKPMVTKAKQTTAPVTTAKNTFVTPTSKPIKHFGGKVQPSSDVKPNVEVLSSKNNKVKRASSPFTPARKVKEESENSNSKKNIKVENTTPASTKKTTKSETASNSFSKKPSRQETNTPASKPKIETPDSSGRKSKDVPAKKGRPSLASLGKSSKSDSKKDTDSSSKKTSDVPSVKGKSDRLSNASSKGKGDDSESSSGLKKQSSSKADTSDKKRKYHKSEDSGKKVTPQAKRRRT